MRRRRALFGIAGLLLFWFVFGYHYKGQDVCIDCKTWVWFDRRGIGNPHGAHIDFLNSVGESRNFARHEFFPEGHAHRLVLGQFSNTWLFDAWACVLGRRATNGFTLALDADEGFREFIKGKIATGSLTRKDAAAVASVPSDWDSFDYYREKFSIRETRADFAPAIDRGSRLMFEYARTGRASAEDWRMWPEK
jgi:hypothetical protein